MSENSSDTHPIGSISIAFLVLQQAVFVLACTGNFFVIYITLRYMKLYNNSNIFILSLAIADFFTGVTSGCQIFYFLFPELNTGFISCALRYLVLSSLTLVSQVTVFLVSVDRYMAVCHQLLYERIMTNSHGCLVTIVALPWVIFALFSSAPLFGWNQWSSDTKCSFSLLFPATYYWTSALTVTILSFASFIIHCCVVHAIRRFYRRIKPINEMPSQDRRLLKNIRGAKVMLIVTVAFTVCWLPYNIFPFSHAIGYRKEQSPKSASSWLAFLGIFNSVLNPFIYAWYKSDFRKGSRKTCSCCYRTSE